MGNKSKATNLSLVMSDFNYLIVCWIRIGSNKGSIPSIFDDSIHGIRESWFTEIANAGKARNSCYKLQVLKKKNTLIFDNAKSYFRARLSLKDKIVPEGVRFLLELTFGSSFENSSYNRKLNRGCFIALNDIRMKCNTCSWYIGGKTWQFFGMLNYKKLTSIIELWIDDQTFINLLHYYANPGYQTKTKKSIPTSIEALRCRTLLPILDSICMYSFDDWFINYLTFNFKKGDIRKKNWEYFRRYSQNRPQVKNKNIRWVSKVEFSWKRMYYFRYADDFVIGVDGSKKDCLYLKNKINDFLHDEAVTVFDLKKIKITHAKREFAEFLGYRIHKTLLKKMPINRNKLGRLCQIVSRPLLDAPIRAVVKQLIDNKYATTADNPIQNTKLIKHRLFKLINHYYTVQSEILNYYLLANNYLNLVNQVHFILKYSCVLTIASKMKLKTKKKVFKKYGKELKIFNEKKRDVCYSTTGYRKFCKTSKNIKSFNKCFIKKITNRS